MTTRAGKGCITGYMCRFVCIDVDGADRRTKGELSNLPLTARQSLSFRHCRRPITGRRQDQERQE